MNNAGASTSTESAVSSKVPLSQGAVGEGRFAKGMQPADIGALVNIGEVRVSPDGSHVAYTVTSVDVADNRYRTRIWVAPVNGTAGPRPLTAGDDGDSLPRWSPDGQCLAFASHREGERAGGEVYVLPVFTGGEVMKVCELAEAASELEWSPNGTRLAIAARNPDTDRYGERGLPKTQEEMSPRRITRLFSRLNGCGFVVDRPIHLFVVPSDGTAAPTLLTPGPYACAGLAWAPDGSCLAFSSARHDSWDLDRAVDLWIVDANGASDPQRLTETGPAYSLPSWSPDGRRLAYNVIDKPRVSPTHSQIGVLDLHRPMVSVPQLLTSSLDRNCEPYPMARAAVWLGHDILFGIDDGGGNHLWRVSGTGAIPPERVVGGERVVSAFDARGGTLAFVAGTTIRLPEVHVVDLGVESGERRLTNVGQAFSDRVKVSAAVPFTAVSEDGTEVPCWAIAPVGVVPGERYPTVLSIHGGPFTQYGLRLFDEFQLHAAAGYAVVYCNPRGSSGYSQAWGRAIRWPQCEVDPGTGWGGVDFQDVMACAETAARDLSFVDGERMGVMGGSYGGYMTSWIIGHTNNFVAAISERAVNNLLTEEHASDIAGSFEDEVGATHLDAPEAYLAHSPVTFVREMTTPLLLVHSEDDLRCPINQAEELFIALRLLGRNPELVRFPAENHELSRSGSPVHRIQRAEIILEWWDRHLR